MTKRKNETRDEYNLRRKVSDKKWRYKNRERINKKKRESGVNKNENKTDIQIIKARYVDLRNKSTNPKYKWANCPFNISIDEYISLSKQPCHLCGDIGLNSADKDIKKIGYTIGNVLPCCWTCNKMRGSLSLIEFKDRISKISKKK